MFRKQIAANYDSVDASVRASLLLRLKECVSEIVMKNTADGNSWIPLKNEEATNLLCWIIEAVFIHGLKNTFIKSLFTTRRENSIPNPSFWDFVMIFSHRNVIEQIRKLNYVNTDVGRSRAWIRITLNEMSLISYLENMFRNTSYVRSFYKPSAFLRDTEKCDILKNYLVGVVETCKFDLVVDNSLLNQWTSGPLALVGLWMDDNISQGIDVAQNMDSKELQTIPQLGKPKTPEPEFVAILRRQCAGSGILGEEDAFRVLMASKGPSFSNNASTSSSRRNSDSSQSVVIGSYPSSSGHISTKRRAEDLTKVANISISAHVPEKHNVQIVIENFDSPSVPSNAEQPSKISTYEYSNTLPPKFESDGDSHSMEAEQLEQVVEIESKTDNSKQDSGEDEELSYAELLEVYNREKNVGTDIYSTSPKPMEADDCGPTIATSETEIEKTISSFDLQEAGNFEDGFEIITTYSSKPKSQLAEMLPSITKYAGKIANEVGMDMQQYSCKLCRAPIGMVFAPARLCSFTGYYFCTNCHIEDISVIPSRILLNWDFAKYSVCKVASEFLGDISEQPLFDVENINPKLYSYIHELTELRDLRIKLHYVSMYLKTCKDQTIFEEFKKEIWPREYLFESVHLYSLSDLSNASNHSLTSPMSKLFSLGKSHILSCKICKAKGFVCEICRNPEVIFPFNLESIFKCYSCGAVYHDKCMDLSKPCPRCLRWKSATIDDEDKFSDDMS